MIWRRNRYSVLSLFLRCHKYIKPALKCQSVFAFFWLIAKKTSADFFAFRIGCREIINGFSYLLIIHCERKFHKAIDKNRILCYTLNIIRE